MKMGKAMVVAVVLVAVLMVSDTQAGWVRKTLGQVTKIVKPAVQSVAVKQVAGLVTKYGVGMLAGIGKRSADFPGSMVGQQRVNMARAKEFLDELELACSRFGINTKVGLSDQVMSSAYELSDGNKDGTLNGQELNLFENIVDAYQHCVEVLKAQGK